MKLGFGLMQSMAVLCMVFLLCACNDEQELAATIKQAFKESSEKLIDYKAARQVFWQEVYPGGGVTLYCGRPFLPKARRSFNIEHVFPMSWATNGLNCGKRQQCRARSDIFNIIEADLHNLYPARTDVNRARDSFRFGEVAGESRRYGQECDFEVDAKNRVAEPREQVRGDIARAMFYMATEYQEQGLELFKRQAKLLAKWNDLDPPSKQELRRNDRIEKIQGNRNPYIDNPQAVSAILKQWY